MDVNNLNNITTNNYSDTSSSLKQTTSTENYTSENFNSTSLDTTSNYQESESMKQNIDELLEEVNEKLKTIDKEITYSLHDKVNRYIITVKDRKTGDIIRECPPKEQLDIFAQILESAGLLFDEFS